MRTDNDKYTQHSGLLGRAINQPQDIDNHIVANPQQQVESLQAELGQQCFKFPGCVDLDNPQAASCGEGYTAVGWDDAGCGSKSCHCGKPICCPRNAAPKNCQWRSGGSGNCDGRCAAREVNIKGFRSSWGGGSSSSTLLDASRDCQSSKLTPAQKRRKHKQMWQRHQGFLLRSYRCERVVQRLQAWTLVNSLPFLPSGSILILIFQWRRLSRWV